MKNGENSPGFSPFSSAFLDFAFTPAASHPVREEAVPLRHSLPVRLHRQVVAAEDSDEHEEGALGEVEVGD
jgi:hypothetical protein